MLLGQPLNGWPGWLYIQGAMQELIERAAHILRTARRAVALTGAGISTPSGIPDFRSAHTGLWEKADPTEVATIYAFRENPARFFNWIRPLAAIIHTARPNAAHLALAQLERAGVLHMVITQNIDGLHQQAGSTQVAEVHGHVRQATCVSCYHHAPAEAFLARFIAEGHVPDCPQCGGVLKPNVTLFGEALPAQAMLMSAQAARRCDVMLIAGSSLEVSPAADLPGLALAHYAKLIIVNLSDTHLDDCADVLIRGDVAEVLPRIAAQVT
ncbi:MAG TPA: NAD-dependent deacylase [Anaerolineae bacterium]|nr:NAD-dependent deacylase [Anaerolineae bacterium]